MACIHKGVLDCLNSQEYSINSTALTKALENAEFEVAAKLIESSPTAGYLNLGPFQNCPLAMLLSGDLGYRHLGLVELLVKGGANPNHHTMTSNCCQGRTPLEYLVTLYLNCAYLDQGGILQHSSLVDARKIKTIGLNNGIIVSNSVLKQQLCELLDLFLIFGANPNVISKTNNSTVFHIVLTESNLDEDLIMKLYEAGGDFNYRNISGKTPLMDLIEIFDLDSAMSVLSKTLFKRSHIPFLEFKNNSRETVLFLSMVAGSPSIARQFIARGADPSASAIVKKRECDDSNCNIVHLSAFFAPLLQNSSLYKRFARNFQVDHCRGENQFDVNLFNKIMCYSVCPVVDGTYLSKSFPEAILNEIKYILCSGTNFLMDQLLIPEHQPQNVALLMFGGFKADLQQLCVRQIMLQLIGPTSEIKNKKIMTETSHCQPENWNGLVRELGFKDGCHNLVQSLTPDVIHRLVTIYLKLPVHVIRRFQIEAARLQLGAVLYNFVRVKK